MDLDKLREQLIIDEGQVNEIYNDHLGYPTFGIGHLVIEGDPELGAPIGTPVSEERVIECFEKDGSEKTIVVQPHFSTMLWSHRRPALEHKAFRRNISANTL